MWVVLCYVVGLLVAGSSEAQININSTKSLISHNFSSTTNVSTEFPHFTTPYAQSSSIRATTHIGKNDSSAISTSNSSRANAGLATPLNRSSMSIVHPPYPVNITTISPGGTAISLAIPSRSDVNSSVHNISTTSRASLPGYVLYPNSTANETKNACQASYESYESAYWWWEPTTQLQFTTVITYDYEYVTYSTELYDCTSKCGSICYAGKVTTIRSTSIFHSTRTATFADNPPFPTPLPNCTIPFDECVAIQSSYSSATSSWDAALTTREWWGTEIEPARPYCSVCSSTACTFNGMFAMSLYYWPPTTSVTRDYCATAPVGGWASTHVPDINHTFVPTTTGPYAVVDNITMYQGNVYISYWEPRVNDNCGAEVTRRNTDATNRVITVASEALFSIRTYPHVLAPWPVTWDLKPYPVNFADFDEPIPWSAYNGQRECAQPGEAAWKCQAVKPDNYFPYMLMPPQIRDLDPAWANCKFDEYAAFDPPIALRPANMFSSSAVLATPTQDQANPPEQTPATPGQQGGWIPVVTPQPTKPQNQVIDDEFNQPPVAQPPPNQVPNAPNPTSGPGANIPPIDLPPEGITVGPSVMPVDPSGALIVQPGIVIKPGDAPATIDGTTISVGPSGIIVVDRQGTSTLPLPAAQPAQQFVTVGTSIMPIDAAGDLIIKPGITLRLRGNALNIEGTTMSLGPSGLIMVDQNGATTIPVPVKTPPQSIFTLGSSTFLVDKTGGIVLRPNQTLRPGSPALTVSGTTYSIGSSGLTVIDSTSTKIVPISGADRQYITVGAQIYTLVNGKLIMDPRLTLSGPGGIAIFQGTTVMLRSESVVVESAGSTSTVSIKSKALGSKTSRSGSSATSKSGAARILNVGNFLCLFMGVGLAHFLVSNHLR